MNFLEKLLYHTAAYSTLITIAVFLFARIGGVSELVMTFGKYFLILLFSVLISSTERIFNVEKIPKPLKYVIHYSVLCIAFYLIFLNVKASDGTSRFSAASIFAAVIIFTVFYLLFMLSIRFIKAKMHKANGQ